MPHGTHGMSELDTIQSALNSAARRRRWQRAWYGLWHGLLAGSGLWLAALATYKLAPIPLSVLSIAGALAGISLVTGFSYGWFHKETLQQTARWVDARENLQERLSTALDYPADVHPDVHRDEWRFLLLTDAARFAQQLDPRKLLPWGLPKISRWALLVLALCAGLGFVPEYRSKAFLEKKRDAQVIKEAGQKVLEITRQNMERRPTALEPTRQALESAEQTGMQLSRNPVTRTDALKDLSSVAEKLKSELKNLNTPAVKSLQQAARQSSRGSGNSADGELQKKIDDLQKSLGKAADKDALDEFKKDLKNAQKAAAGMPKDDGPASAAARQQMEQTLSKLAQEAKDLGQKVPSLDEAVAALQANQIDSLTRDLDAATTDLDKLQDMAKSLEQLQQQAKEGKDLPEQLKYGQAETAQRSLQKMIDQLKSGMPAPEQLSKLVDELSRSVDPASPYGKAAEDLKQAVKQLQSNRNSDAAQSLAEASKELQNALDQMQDAKSVMASLEAVQKAEMAIATRANWGQTAMRPGGGSQGMPGHGRGRGGKGVGTWTDDDSQLYPEMTELTDNSGERPDQDPRGLTDRGDPQLSDNLAPTKLQGKIMPGASMPSISLKGVSIKGQSSVQYQEAAAAAQSDAQSALNQDQVPRAYQSAVRDYFDDLKK